VDSRRLALAVTGLIQVDRADFASILSRWRKTVVGLDR
jgi:hypothetical protein